MNIISLSSYFPGAHQVSFKFLKSYKSGYAAIVDVWQTEEYKSIRQYLIFTEGLQISSKFLLTNDVKWNCFYKWNEDDFLLGSDAKSSNQSASLAVFRKGEITIIREFYRGVSTSISRIESVVDGSLLITGVFYKVVAAGGHDDYYPELWTQKVSPGFEDAGGTTEVPKDCVLVDTNSDSYSKPGDYYSFKKNIVEKYNAQGELLWDQDIAITGQEDAFLINSIFPYYKSRGTNPKSDGVWAAGAKLDDDHKIRSGFSTPILFRLSSGGSILRYSSAFEPFPHLIKVISVISGDDNDGYILGETLKVGEGNGLFLMHLDLPGSTVLSFQYLNYTPGSLDLASSDRPVFSDIYHALYNVFPIVTKGKFCFHVFANVSNYVKKQRDNGKIFQIECR